MYVKEESREGRDVREGRPVPEVDRGRGDARTILGVILQKTDDELYQLGTNQGVVKTLYSRQQFTVCHQELLKKEDVPNLETTLRTVATLHSRGQILCTLKCHNSSSCKKK
ncbi:hypothetical protein ACJJTC_011982 [Scirpophaga incertulas]